MKKFIKRIFFIGFILVVIIYNISVAAYVKIYFNNEQVISEENLYCVDIYAETTDKIIGGFQLKLWYSNNLKLINDYTEPWDIGNVTINEFDKKIVGYKNENVKSSPGKIKLCTLVFEIIEKSIDNNYDVKIDFNNNYSRIIDINGEKISFENENTMENNKPNNNPENEENKSSNENTNNSNTNNNDTNNNIENIPNNTTNKPNNNDNLNKPNVNEETINNQNSITETGNKETSNHDNVLSIVNNKNDKNQDSTKINKVNSSQKNSNTKMANKLPKTGKSIIIINAIIINIIVCIVLVIKYKIKDRLTKKHRN